MIRPRYALRLARTKLHSKRGILITSIIIASLLFAALIACVIIFTAAEKSANTFVKKAGNDRYLVQVRPNIPDKVLGYTRDYSREDIEGVKAFEKEYYTNLRAKYKQAGVTYDTSTEVSAVKPDPFKPESLPEDQRITIDRQSPIAEAWFAKKLQDYATTAPNTIERLKAIGETYGATGYYIQTPAPLPPIPQSRLILNDKEDFSVNEMRRNGFTPYDSFVQSAYNSTYQFQDSALLSRYLLPQESSTLKGIPVIITAQEAASLFGKEVGIGDEPKSATDIKEWLKSIQKKLNNHTYQVCIRNSTEQAMLTKIQSDYVEVQSNKGNTDYIAPSLQYQYPSTPCGDITVKQDTRTQKEKQSQAKSEEVQKKLGTYIAPAHQLVTFQVVGFIYALPYTAQGTSAQAYIKSLLSPQDPSQTAIIPLQHYGQLPEHIKFGTNLSTASASQTTQQPDTLATRILEFNSIPQARAFLDTEACRGMDTSCAKPFYADPYGSNYLIIDEIGKLFQKVINIALPVLLGLALVIVWFTIARIMAENRKETAVYRAMGARRSDIAAIYLTYVSLIALRIAIASFILGIASAYIIDHIYGAQLNAIALGAFGIISDDLRFSLFDLSSPLLWVLFPVIIAVSFIASVQPLIRNVMRSPIQDMREE